MGTSDLIALFVAIFTLGGVLWAVASWSIDKKHQRDQEMEGLKKTSLDQQYKEIKELILGLRIRMEEQESFQKASTVSVMKQFHALELSMKDYSKDVSVHSEQLKQQKADIDKLWTTVATDIGEGRVRVSSGNKKY